MKNYFEAELLAQALQDAEHLSLKMNELLRGQKAGVSCLAIKALSQAARENYPNEWAFAERVMMTAKILEIQKTTNEEK